MSTVSRAKVGQKRANCCVCELVCVCVLANDINNASGWLKTSFLSFLRMPVVSQACAQEAKGQRYLSHLHKNALFSLLFFAWTSGCCCCCCFVSFVARALKVAGQRQVGRQKRARPSAHYFTCMLDKRRYCCCCCQHRTLC